MFNGYNETPLISYNEFSQERVEKKTENVPKWSYDHDVGPQPTQTNRSSDFWPGKTNFLGVPNVVKCNCTGYYSTSESQSYQGENARHRPWLPRSFPVPINNSSDSCKLPSYQWDGLSNQSTCYTEGNLPYVQENGEKYPYYRHYQNPKLTEPNQSGVITSVKEAEYGKKTKIDIQNGRQTVYDPGYKRNHCDPNGAPYTVEQHVPRLPIEPFTKAVPSNLTQNRVPSTGYRSVKENMYETGYDVRKTCQESGINSSTGQVHMDYTHFTEVEPKSFFDNTRHVNYYPRNYPEVIKRNQALDSRKDCALMGQTTPEMHYNPTRYKPYDAFEKTEPEYSNCFQDGKTDNLNVHARLPRSALLFNDPRYADKTQNQPSYQSNQIGYKNLPYQGNISQPRYDCPGGFQRTDPNQFRPCQQMQSCEFAPPGGGFMYNLQNFEKTQEFSAPVQIDSLISENPKPNYLEAIRSEEIKNGTSKISPLRLLRKKKFINVPQEPSITTLDAPPGLDVRKFWSTWAEEEEENVAPTEMVVLDCQNIDPEQAKLLHLYDDPSRPVSLENIVIKNAKESNVPSEEIKTPEDIETLPEPVSMKSLRKGKSESREKKKTEGMDKWTEKKFDFLKRAEESKAAEILRHEEEKKKIFETRLSLQQSLKKPGKQEKISTGEGNAHETLSPLDENSRSESPEVGTAGDLPTCEYRRNKFLDYSEKNVLPESMSINAGNVPDGKVKEEVFEMDDILRKISEINVESSEVKLETELNESKKLKRKTKKKKAEPDGERTDKVTVETVAKPTIKFSIQKSHDLKISFKVLNSKENEEEVNAEDKSSVEDSKNSTEMITLKYKSIQREGDRRPKSEGRKARKGFRRKKQATEMKTPVLKIKKSRYTPEEDKDPFEEDETPMNPEISASDDFQVQETVDSAKIKLTFKRHKGTLETECRVNSGSVEKIEEVDAVGEEHHENLEPTGRPKESGVFEEAAVEPLHQTDSDMGNGSESQSVKNTEEPDYPTFPNKPHAAEFTGKEESIEKPETKTGNERGQVETNVPERNESSDKNSESVREISLDFIKSTKSPEIETNHKTRKTEENSDLENRIQEISPESKSSNWKENLEGGGDVGLSLLDFENQTCDLDKNSLPFNATPNEGLDISVGDDFSPGNAIVDEPEDRLNAHMSIDPVILECENSTKLELFDFEKKERLEDLSSVDLSIDSTKVELSSFEKECSENFNADVSVDNRIKCQDTLGDPNKVELSSLEKEELPQERLSADGSINSVGVEFSDTFRDLTKLELPGFMNEKLSEDINADVSLDTVTVECDEDTAKVELSDFEKKELSDDNSSADMSIDTIRVDCDEDLTKMELSCFYKEELPEDNLSADMSIDTIRVDCGEDLTRVDISCFDKEELPDDGLSADLSIDTIRVDCGEDFTKVDISCFEKEELPDDGLSADVSVDLTSDEIIMDPSKIGISGPKKEELPVDELSAVVSIDVIKSETSVDSSKLELSCLEKENFPEDLSANVSIENRMECVETVHHLTEKDLSGFENEGGRPEPPNSLLKPCNILSCDKTTENQTDLFAYSELEDGEIVDSSDELEAEKEQNGFNTTQQKPEFIVRKIKRRNSGEQVTWSRRKFSKAKSCPPEITSPDVPVEEIPLPFGPPPRENCWEAKEKPSISRQPDSPFCQSPFGLNDLKNCRNPSPPESESSGIFPGSSKIRFSILKRNRFSKQTPTEKVRTPECQEVPNMNVKPVELSEDLDTVQTIDGVTELYECEGIPTSEDLTNGDDPEIEKVNDDKFRNIMQNCLENAKKFLNVGNLKLFSCSVDDLLELSCQPETEKSEDHICQDVLCSSCEDTNDNLNLSERVQPPDTSMDFLPSDVCPEILPVDNWPYLEEEVPSSPIKSKPEETDLLAGLEHVPEKLGRKRVVSETDFKNRNVSLKIGAQRRKTIDTFTEASYGRDVKSELLRFKNEMKKNTLKCRLSLEKLTNKRSRKNVDYKSPSWQPKVMLFRISKNELRKTLGSVDTHKKNGPALEKPKLEYVTFEKVKTDAMRKRKKSRFRNLHTKRKNEPEGTFAQHTKLVGAETVLTEIFKKSDPVPKEGGEKPKLTVSQSKTTENVRSHEKETKQRENKKHDHRDRRRDKEERKDKHREGERKHGKSKRRNEEEANKERHKSGWVCEVCGFSDESERVAHIRNHPFHCQSCHLAFKTEAHFIDHLTRKHKDIRNQHHCLLCEMSFDTEDEYQRHLETREHTHLESVEKNTINTLFTLLTGAPCPVLGLVEMKPEWLPNQSGTVHFYHQATPLSLALQYLKMHHLSKFSLSSHP